MMRHAEDIWDFGIPWVKKYQPLTSIYLIHNVDGNNFSKRRLIVVANDTYKDKIGIL